MAELNEFTNFTVADAEQIMENFNELDRRAALAQLFQPDDPQPVGLYFAYGAGRIRKADGTVVEIAAGQVALTGEATNYVEIDSDGVVSASTTGFTDSKKPIAVVETLSATIDSVTDQRIGFGFGEHYTPAEPSHWAVSPTTTTEALDMIAARINGMDGPV